MSISVVYLAYYNKNYGYTINVVERFLQSYKENPAGIEHSLVIVAKNWTDKSEYEKLQKYAKAFNAKIINLPDDGWDFGAYFRVSKLLNSEYVLYLGSSIVIRSANWLRHHYSAFKQDEKVQLVGAMGSWGFAYTTRSFPNYHIRTCSFMMRREFFLEYASTQKFPVTKEDTYEMEHGEDSLTMFPLNKGYKAVVVNSDGQVFEPDDWDVSDTFRTRNPWKSMFSDKQSMSYYLVKNDERDYLEKAAWGRVLKDTKIKIIVNTSSTSHPMLQTDIYSSVFNGAEQNPNALKVLKDNTEENISDKNVLYGELTGHYWVWKNLLPKLGTEYVGFSQYRRFLDFNLNLNPSSNVSSAFATRLVLEFQKMFEKYSEENILNFIGNSDVILPNYSKITEPIREISLDIVSKDDIETVLTVIKEFYPEYLETAENVINSDAVIPRLVFVMKKPLLEAYFDWSFGILKHLQEQITAVAEDRKFALIAEYLLAIWLDYKVKNDNVKIIESTSVFIEFDVDAYMKKCMALIEQSKQV